MIDPNERTQFVVRASRRLHDYNQHELFLIALLECACAALRSQCCRWTLFQNAIMIRRALSYLAAASKFVAEGEDAVMRTTLITAAEGFVIASGASIPGMVILSSSLEA